MDDPKKVPVQPEEKITSEEKIFSAIGYLGILCLIPLLLKRESKFCQLHGKQGLVFLIACVILGAVSWIPILGRLVGVVGGVILFILGLLGIINALIGNYWKMPVLGDYAEKLKI